MKLLPVLNLVALLITLFINFLSQTASTVFGLDLFPTTVAQLGESRALFFLPAGYVFGIWGIIYTGLIAYALYQLRPVTHSQPLHSQIGFWFILSCFGNSLWLVLFLYDYVALSTLAMALILVSLLMIYQRLGIGITPVSRAQRWFVHLPFSIYLGWISVATIANIAAMLYVDGAVTSWIGINADVWAVIMMAIATLLAFAMLWLRRDIAFALVVVWALIGIYVRPFNTEVFSIVSTQNTQLVDMSAMMFSIAIALTSVVVLWLSRTSNTPSSAAPAMS